MVAQKQDGDGKDSDSGMGHIALRYEHGMTCAYYENGAYSRWLGAMDRKILRTRVHEQDWALSLINPVSDLIEKESGVRPTWEAPSWRDRKAVPRGRKPKGNGNGVPKGRKPKGNGNGNGGHDA